MRRPQELDALPPSVNMRLPRVAADRMRNGLPVFAWTISVE